MPSSVAQVSATALADEVVSGSSTLSVINIGFSDGNPSDMGASTSAPKPPPTLGPAAPAPPEPSKKRQPKAPPTPRPLKRPRRSCRGPAPIPETPVAVLVAGGATAVVRKRAHQLTLQGAHRCFGQVRAVTGAPADRAPGETETPKFGTEVRLGLHEMCYLAARDRVIIRETSDGDALDGAEIRRRCGAWAPLGDVRFDATLAVYAHFRDKKWIVKDGLQFGADFVLYRRSPDVFHAEYCVVVAERDEIVPWRRCKANARLSSDVRKHLCIAYAPPPGSAEPVVEIIVDDAFARPADANAGKRRQKVPTSSDAHKKRPRDDDGGA